MWPGEGKLSSGCEQGPLGTAGYEGTRESETNSPACWLAAEVGVHFPVAEATDTDMGMGGEALASRKVTTWAQTKG